MLQLVRSIPVMKARGLAWRSILVRAAGASTCRRRRLLKKIVCLFELTEVSAPVCITERGGGCWNGTHSLSEVGMR